MWPRRPRQDAPPGTEAPGHVPAGSASPPGRGSRVPSGRGLPLASEQTGEFPPTAGTHPKPPPSLLLKRLRWPIRRRAASHLGGTERSHLRGAGPELAELREYVPGDDVRQIDWHVTARTDRPFVRLAEVERGLDALLVVDLSRSVDWGTARCHRRERAVDICAAAGELLIRQGNR